MATAKGEKLSEAEIAVHWQEEENYQPPQSFIGQANLRDKAIFERFSQDRSPGATKSMQDYWIGTAAGIRSLDSG